MILLSLTDRDTPRVWKNYLQEENILLRKKMIKNEHTQKNKLFDPKYFLTPQFCHSAI